MYIYEGSCTTLFAAWFASLGWPKKLSASKLGLSSVGKLLVLAGGVGLSFSAMMELDYYERCLDKHAAWIGFHGLLGVLMAQSGLVVSTLLKAERLAPMIADTFCMLGYHSGYALFPVLVLDQMSAGG